MAKYREIRGRIQGVDNTAKITQAMKMVAAAKLRRAQDSIIAARPYGRKLRDLLQFLAANMETAISPLLEEREVERVCLVVVAADRGLCGAFNSNLIKLTKATIADKYAEQKRKGNVTIWNIGKKGYEHFLKLNYKADASFKDIFLNLTFENVQLASQAAMKAFEEKQFDVVEIVYSQFKNAATQKYEVERFLPIPKVEKKEGGTKADFIFDPTKEELVAELMPKILNTQLFKAVLDSNASEHGARMTAMDKASENANEMLRNLKISYNRARQAAITTELTEIVSGAAALQG